MVLNITDLQQEQKILPLLRLGFRPFFLFGSVFALLSVAIWLLTLKGILNPHPLNGILWWHSHEMLFGFVTAIIAGFLLTAVQTWTSIPGVKGIKLLALFTLWATARIVIFYSPAINPVFIMLIDVAFLPLTTLLLGLPLFNIRMYRNMIFIPILLLMSFSNAMTYLPQFSFSAQWATQGLHSMVLLVTLLVALLGGRVIPMFTANGVGITKVLPIKWLEVSALSILFLLYAGFLLGLTEYTQAFGVLSLIAAGLHTYRWLRWRPWLTLKVPLVWALHFTMIFIPIGLALIALHFFTNTVSLSAAIHSLTVGAIGGMILAMMSRVSLGHTGRPLTVNRLMQAAFASIVLAAVTRSILIALLPAYTLPLTLLSGIFWCIAFSGFLWVYIPILSTPRLDRRPG